MMRRGWARFLVEAAFIVAVAVAARLADLGAAWIVGLVLGAWALTALVERAASQRLSSGAIAAIEAAVEAEEEPDGRTAGAEPGPPAAEEPREPAPAPPEEDPHPAPEPAAEPEPKPERRGLVARLADEHRPAWPARRRRRAPRRAAEERPRPQPRPCATCGRPIPIERLEALPDATQCLDCRRTGVEPAAAEAGRLEPLPARREAPPPLPEPVFRPRSEPVAPPEPEPRPEPPPPAAEPAPAVEPEPVTPAPASEAPLAPVAPVAPQRWNVWQLERAARARAGRDVARDEEWGFLLVYLREFADPDGNLPSDFDGLVRESFAELLGAAPAR